MTSYAYELHLLALFVHLCCQICHRKFPKACSFDLFRSSIAFQMLSLRLLGLASSFDTACWRWDAILLIQCGCTFFRHFSSQSSLWWSSADLLHQTHLERKLHWGEVGRSPENSPLSNWFEMCNHFCREGSC